MMSSVAQTKSMHCGGYARQKGTMQDGREFVVTDDWTNEDKEDKNSIRQPWTGTTTFVMRTPENRLGRVYKTEEKHRRQGGIRDTEVSES